MIAHPPAAEHDPQPPDFDPHDPPGVAAVIIAQNRSGGTDAVRLAFRRDILRFETMDWIDDLIPF